MNTKAKANSVITHRVSAINSEVLVFEVLGVGELRFDTSQAHDIVRANAERHGWIQRISDAAAISRDPETGKPASAQDKFDAMSRLVAHYESGTAEWSRKPVAGEREKGGLLFKALCQMSPSKSPEEIRVWMGTKTKKELNKIRVSERVSAVIDAMRPTADDVDLSELGL